MDISEPLTKSAQCKLPLKTFTANAPYLFFSCCETCNALKNKKKTIHNSMRGSSLNWNSTMHYAAPTVVSSPASIVDAKVDRLVGCTFGDSQSICMLPVGNEAVE